MDTKRQKELTDEICKNLAEHLKSQIEKGKIQESWDRIEFRWFIENQVSWVASSPIMKKRKKEFKNTCIINGL